MIRFVHSVLLMLACSVLLLSGCGAGQPETAERTRTLEHPLTCIVVLPAVADPEDTEAAAGQLDEELLAGAEAMNELLRQELGGRPDVRFVDAEYIAGLESTGGETDLEMIRLVARSVECNGVLQSRLQRYSERIGGRFTAEEPAAVTFDMNLISVDTGGVLWATHFEETQKSVLENLYEWGKAKSRGFTWITARDLLLEGIREKFAASPYFREQREKSPPAAVKSADEKV
ncbi:MAG: hypothetical protein RBR09_05725 [Desulfobulbaceae bacterium]|nr:hypothetical protein [Desulfobulbaceae bacterium]MDY0350736.1 hypothetical protein [Desulfobulbaceae bacterium]